MNVWPYLIPTLDAAPKKLRIDSVYSADQNDVRIGIYCQEESHGSEGPWLLGSFYVELSERNNGTTETPWHFIWHYPTGDGHLLKLALGSPQALNEDTPVSSQEVMMMWDASKVRQRFPLKCRVCDLGATYRAETVQPVLRDLWRAGMRECSLRLFMSAVARVAR